MNSLYRIHIFAHPFTNSFLPFLSLHFHYKNCFVFFIFLSMTVKNSIFLRSWVSQIVIFNHSNCSLIFLHYISKTNHILQLHLNLTSIHIYLLIKQTELLASTYFLLNFFVRFLYESCAATVLIKKINFWFYLPMGIQD